jgi:outer membrane protein assembly factor BamC
MKNLKNRAVGIALLALNLPACETLQSFFPDKQKDYRYSAEIPPLEIPPELKSDTIKLEDDLHPSIAAQGTPEAVVEAPSATSREVPLKTAESPQQGIVSWTEGGSRLLIDKNFEIAWFMVAKALLHKAIEVNDRDRSQGVFFVHYDPEKYEIRDGSLWDEVAFFFGARDSNELPYRVRVLESGERTEVAVTDDSDAPVTQGPGLSLLKLLFESIKTDAEGKSQAEGDENQKADEEKGSDDDAGKNESAPADSEKQPQ